MVAKSNVHKDYIHQLDHLEAMAWLPSSQIVSFDGIHFKDSDNWAKYGYSLKNEPLSVLQIVIDGKAYAVHAAMTVHGFIAWEIFDHDVYGIDVASFIRHRVAPLFGPNDYLLLDNARNHKTAEVIEALDTALGSRFKFNSEYSPELNPIEHGFSLVRSWIRTHEYQYACDHLGLINAAFFNYSVYGPEGYQCANFFNIYENNHRQFFENPDI